MSNNPLKNLPSVHELLESPQLRRLMDRVNRHVVVQEVRSFLDHVRSEVRARAEDLSEIRVPAAAELAERIANWIGRDQRSRLRPVINATGILLHTGLGRAPLAEEAVEEMAAVARGYCSLEVDLATGDRSRRAQAVDRMLTQLTGAEAALVVNNNAAATLLALAAIGAGREVIVSRGQLIEIGGSYRLPDVMTASGARLREVGTTNKTRISDYEMAIGDQTAALMRVHTSNYVVQGFAESVSVSELVELGRRYSLPVIDDIGSGALVDFARYGLTGEPLAPESVRAGADVVLFSGDKLLGGPQAGILVGRRTWIERMEKHPLARALRVDKLTLAALAATLRLYLAPAKAEERIPLLSMLSTSTENLKSRAERLATQLAAAPAVAEAVAVEAVTFLGGGSLPTQQLPTWCVALRPRQGTTEQMARQLRLSDPSVFARIQQDRILLDLRAVRPSEDRYLADVVLGLQPPTAEADVMEAQVEGSDQAAPDRTDSA